MSGYFEDFVIGETVELGSHAFTAEDIVSFAERFDPQRFHLDHDAAKETIFGGLCASGWHTAAVWMRLMVQYRQRTTAEIAAAGGTPARLGPSPGFRELKWIKPVYAGDVIAYRSTPEDKVELRSRPGWGLLVTRNEGVNQSGDVVFSFLGQVFVERRPADLPRSA
ncbi:MAG: MaoC family dehydratase [Hyphomicrobiales bacterium]|nr:MaoC family dehydratase [Hyphomicrobiales bacterium]